MCQFCSANPEKPCVECGKRVCVEKREICIDCGGWICPECKRSTASPCNSCWRLRAKRWIRVGGERQTCQTKS